MRLQVMLLISALLASSGLAQPPTLSALDLARATEVQHVIQTHGRAVWPGWMPPPQLVRAGDADYLIGHPNPPTGFARVPGLSLAGQGVYRRSGHLIPVPAATAWPVADLWVLAIPTLKEFQRAVDQVLGVGVVKLDDAAYIAAAVHEGFHAHQMNTVRQPPMFGFKGDEQTLLTGLGANPDLVRQLVGEGQVLHSAVTRPDLPTVWTNAVKFLELRQARREKLPADVGAFEQSLEWREGLARYAQVSLMRLVAAQPSVDARFTYPTTAWTAFLEQLADVSKIPGTVRDAYYALGAGEAFLLDRLMPGWKSDVLPGGMGLEQRLIELTRRAQGISRPLLSFPFSRLEWAGQTLWVALADQPERWRQGLGGVSNLGGLDGMLFCFPEEIRVSFSMKGALMPLDIAFFAADGSLIRVMRMDVCNSGPCPVYGPDRAFKYALETPAGRLTPLPGGSWLRLSP